MMTPVCKVERKKTNEKEKRDFSSKSGTAQAG